MSTAPTSWRTPNPLIRSVLVFGTASVVGLLFGSVVGTSEAPAKLVLFAVFGAAVVWAMLSLNVAVALVVAAGFLQLGLVASTAFGVAYLGEVLFVIGVASYLLHRREVVHIPSAIPRFILLTGAYGMVLLASSFTAAEPSRSFALTGIYVRDVVLAAIVVLAVRYVRTFRAIVWGLLLAGLVVASLSVYQYLTGSFSSDFFGLSSVAVHEVLGSVEEVRSSGPVGDPNFYAQILVFLVPLALDRAVHERGRLRLVAGASAAVLVTALVFTFSRGGFIALVVIVAAILVHKRPQPSQLLVALLLVGLLFAIAPRSYLDRVLSVGDLVAQEEDEQIDESFQGRTSEAIVGLQMFRDRPLLGVGAGNYAGLYQEYALDVGVDPRRSEREPHSLFIGIAAETGVVGLVAMGTVLVVTLRGIGRTARRWRELGHGNEAEMAWAFRLGLVAFLVAALFLHLAFARTFWILIAVAVTLPSLAFDPIRERAPAVVDTSSS